MRNYIVGIFILLSLVSKAQLPSDWLGHYKGELTSVNLEGKESRFDMELIISEDKDSSYNFTIIYASGEVRQERAYQLIPDGKNHYLLDEQNGIVLDISQGKDRLVSFFNVQESYLHVCYIFTKKGMRFELTSSVKGKTNAKTTNENGEDIPAVYSYKTTSFQFAALKKLKK